MFSYFIAVLCKIKKKTFNGNYFIFPETNINIEILFISGKNSFVVLLLHCGLDSSLPRLQSASKLGNMEKYKNVEFIDVAYNIDSKLYPCEMNTIARSQLQTFLSKNRKA
jgi:hypothetical protein